MVEHARDSSNRTRLIVGVLVVVAFAVVLIRTAWLGDDAYITFRTADNFLNGLGLRWNADERVQAFTHPLWLALFTGAYAATGEAYFTAVVLSVVLTLACVFVYVSAVAKDAWAAAFGAAVLLSSKAFIDFSTGGLENPLTHLLLVVFFVGYWRWPPGAATVFKLSLLAALIGLNRMDAGVLVLPALVAATLRSFSLASLAALAAGMLPAAAWEVFSIVYYGFAFPNTAYAKLNTGIEPGRLFQQGLYYFADVIRFDPITPAVIALALVLVAARPRRTDLAVWLGIVGYLIYVLRIGGDFMRGRFFAAPLLLSVFVLTRGSLGLPRKAWPFAAAAALLLGLAAPYQPTLLSSASFGSSDLAYRDLEIHGVHDERRWYYPQTGVLRQHAGVRVRPPHRWAEAGRWWARHKKHKLMVTGNVGFFGFHAGPRVVVIDTNALADPLLARLPAKRTWRIGHFTRTPPRGYAETRETGKNRIAHARLAEFYDHLSLITRGPLWDRQRWIAIWRMNTGRYDPLIEQYLRDAGTG